MEHYIRNSCTCHFFPSLLPITLLLLYLHTLSILDALQINLEAHLFTIGRIFSSCHWVSLYLDKENTVCGFLEDNTVALFGCFPVLPNTLAGTSNVSLISC